MLPKLREFSPEEYLLIERRAEYKSEYIDGMIYAMAGASPNHSVIVGNLIAGLHNQLQPTPCLIFPSKMKVRIPDRRKFLYPDISVIYCGNTE
jgi:Uma2 family endonuclease